MIEQIKRHFCPYCKEFSIVVNEYDAVKIDLWVCTICGRFWPVPREEENEHSSERS